MFKYTSRKPLQATFRTGEQPGRGIPSIQELGAMLRERREAMGASLAEVETATRIRQKYLAALESDEWNLLPGEVIGRGFLRNYSTYLGLDATEAIERRRTVADPSLAGALSDTSAGSALPPMREVDYRPKDVAIRDEPEPIEQRELRLTPIFTGLGIIALLFFVLWGFIRYGEQVSASAGGLIAAVQTRVAPDATATPTQTPAAQIANTIVENTPAAGGDSSAANDGTPPANNPVVSTPLAPSLAATRTREIIIRPTDTPAAEVANAPAENAAPADTSEPTVAPTETPVVAETPTEAPTETPAETPTETPTEVPTEVPAPVVAAAQCPDPRSVLSSPGVNQTLSGVAQVTGRAVHENFDYYKLEFAPAGGGFTYFGGEHNAVDGGLLGIFDTTALPNGAYTLQLTVVDKSANYPPPCQVSVIIQN
ncbi:MAG: helix-turn-helix domain-containing protein [Chloroflexi bacterium]|nr:helix-turn-helix domain-containing protein [Chloroflexota bacterium]